MAHADDIGKYEGPPCEICRVSQFVGTCTHRPRKYPEYTFPDFTTDEFQQMKAQKDKMLADQRSEIEKERDALLLQNQELQKNYDAMHKLWEIADREWRNAERLNGELRALLETMPNGPGEGMVSTAEESKAALEWADRYRKVMEKRKGEADAQ